MLADFFVRGTGVDNFVAGFEHFWWGSMPMALATTRASSATE
jgi:hypothetical protein